MKPLIAITGRRISGTGLVGLDPRWAAGTVDMYWAEFGSKLAAAGGLPVQLPYESADPEVIRRIDALVLTGGQDVDPAVWGGPPSEHATDGEVLAIDRRRDDYEISLVREAIVHGVPVLGICRGHQILNVALGGTLITDLPDSGVRHLSEESIPDRRPEKEHPVVFAPETVAASLYGSRHNVNSWHHQAIAELGGGLIVSGRALDGVVEAIELPDRDVLGLQWHPEALVEVDPCFGWIVDRARSRQPVGGRL